MSVYVRVRNGMAPNESSGLGGVTEGDFRGNVSDVLNAAGCVVDVSGGHLLVHEATVPDMTVEVDPGVGYIPNSNFDELDSDSIKAWEAVVDALVPLVISANSSGSTRIDLICLYLDTSIEPNEFGSNVASVVVVEGTPGAGQPATPDDHLLLAAVTVVDGETAILNADISDERIQLSLKAAVIPAGATELADVGVSGYTASELLRVNAGVTAVESSGQVLPTGDLVGTSDTQTQTNKRITKRVSTAASSATPTPSWDTDDEFHLTALAAAAELQNPTGTPTSGQPLVIRIKDNGTGRALTYDTQYRAIGIDLPTTTTANKTMYLGAFWNAADSKVDVVAVAEEE